MIRAAERVGGWVWRLARRIAAWFGGRRYDTGPSAAHAVTSRPGAGFTSRAAIRYTFTGGRVAVTPDLGAELRERRIVPGDELRYAVLPEWSATGDVRDGFAADAVALDLVLDDGSLLSAYGVRDQYGVALDPRAQHEGAALHPDQWNLVRVALDAVAGRVVAGVRLRVVETRAPGAGRRTLVGWLDTISIGPVAPEPERPADRARTRQGTMSTPALSRGNTAPTVAVPGGFVGGIPVTRADSARWPYTWHADNTSDNRSALQAFATSHLPSPWMGERGAFQVMPVLPPPPGEPVPTSPGARALGFSHDDEIARPHDYRVTLDGGIHVEMTATDHTVLVRVGFPPGTAEGVLVFDQIDGHGAVSLPGETGAPGDALRAYTDDGTEAQRDRAASPRAYLHAQLDRPIVAADRVRTGLRTPGESPRAWVRVALDASATVTVRLATSFIGTAQAERNLALDGADAPFDEVRERAGHAWDAWIGRIGLPSGDGETAGDGTSAAAVEQRAMMATALYRVGLFPARAHENLGTAEDPDPRYASPFHPVDGSSADRTGARVLPGELSVSHGFWDTYRTAWPLYALLDPERAGRLLDGFIEHYRASGWTSRWSSPGPVDSMTGTSLDTVTAQAVDAGVPVDLWNAFDAALRNASVPSTDPRLGRKGLATSAYRGWVDTDTHEGLTWTLDGSINDLAVARLARALLDRVPAAHERRGELVAAAAYFTARAGSYAHVFDPRTGFFLGRDARGRFRMAAEAYDPTVWGFDYTETNGWGTAFSVPHDGAGLAALHGGREALARRLEQFFAVPERGDDRIRGSYPIVIHEMVEARNLRAGQWAPSNQPAHHIPFMALFAGRPDLAQHAVRTAVERMFTGGEIGQGWPGDEDNGEMAAWWVFAALGLYPLVPATAGYVIVAPAVPEARVRLGDDAWLVIRAPGASRSRRFVRSVLLDGQPWTSAFLPHERVARGATLDIELSDEPEPWGSAPADEPPSLTPHGRLPTVLRDLTTDAEVQASTGATGSPADAVDDDAASPGVALKPGEWVAVTGVDGSPEILTVTVDAAGRHRFRLEAGTDDGWRTVLRVDTAFTWDRQLRPFVLPPHGPARGAAPVSRWRLVAESAFTVRQLELLVREEYRLPVVRAERDADTLGS